MIEPNWLNPRNCQPRAGWRLRNGRAVRLDAFYFDLTYAGLLVGAPTAELNARIVRTACEKAARLFDEEPYLLPFATTPDLDGNEWLPPLRYAARIESAPRTNHASDSVLVVAGFTTPLYDRPLIGFLSFGPSLGRAQPRPWAEMPDRLGAPKGAVGRALPWIGLLSEGRWALIRQRRHSLFASYDQDPFTELSCNGYI